MAKTKKNEEEQPIIGETVELQKDSINESTSNEKVVNRGHTTIVIPYVKSKAQGNELLYALRSLEQNIRFGANFVVIGDKEEWFSEEITFIEHTCISENPQIDVAEKLKLAIASEYVTDNFIWTNDDIYLLSPVLLGHLEIPKAKGLLDPVNYNGFYRENMSRTMELLLENECSTLDYGTHTPIVYNKYKLVEMFEKHPELLIGGYLLSSFYFNWMGVIRPIHLDWKKDVWAISIVSKSPDPELFDIFVAEKLFLNNAESGYSEWFESKLNELFPQKSSFEK